MDDILLPDQNIDAAVENDTPVDSSPTPEKVSPEKIMANYRKLHPEVTDDADLDQVVMVLCPDVKPEDRKRYFK